MLFSRFVVEAFEVESTETLIVKWLKQKGANVSMDDIHGSEDRTEEKRLNHDEWMLESECTAVGTELAGCLWSSLAAHLRQTQLTARLALC